MFPFMFPEASFTAAAENVSKITTLAGINSGSVLDLACGPGRYAIPFALAGFTVTGVDRTRFLLDHARDRATAAGADVHWVEQDMGDFVRPAAFDLAINVFTSFGYFDDAAENRRVLENVLASLKPDGTFVFDHLGKEFLAARYQPTRSESLPGGAILIHRTEIIDDWSASRVNGFCSKGGTPRRSAFATGSTPAEKSVNCSKVSGSPTYRCSAASTERHTTRKPNG